MLSRLDLTAISLVLATGVGGCATPAPPAAKPQTAAPAAAQEQAPNAAQPTGQPTAQQPAAAPSASSSAQSAAPAPTESANNEPVPAPDQDDAQPKSNEPPAGTPLEQLMRAHFKEVTLIRTALIQGRAADAVAPAAALAGMDTQKQFPQSWREVVRRMQDSSKRIKDSNGVAQSAAAMADIGTSCGQCHQKLGGPKTVAAPAPPSDSSLVSRMARHAWATERLWEGLYVPSEKAWNGGAAVLAHETEPFPPDLLKKGGVHVRTAAQDFARLAQSTPAQKSPSDRAALYAQLLETCGVCHQMIGKGGK